MKKFRDFESAREFARSLGLQSRKEWVEYYKSTLKTSSKDVDQSLNTTNT